ncbi:unnamed protein product, partial [Soboliphyme baturini]|uniref:Peptidase M12B domain-containing protein n=1 Tax=Soboliphyme baturini TaxID=241478 RepID=A0A183J0I7_9BILA
DLPPQFADSDSQTPVPSGIQGCSLDRGSVKATVSTAMTLSAFLLVGSLSFVFVEEQAAWRTQVPLFEIGRNGVLKRIHLQRPSKTSHRTKRSVEVPHPLAPELHSSDNNTMNLSIDLLLIADDSVYDSFLTASNGDEYSCVSAIHQYFSGILYEVSRIYSSNKLGDMKFTLYPVGIIITKHQSQVPWTSEDMYDNESSNEHRLKAAEALMAFKDWIQRERDNLPEHDHAMAITKRDLSRSGIAYIKSICKIGESISLVEDLGGMATAAVAGHELAHSLGAQHDGDKINDYCPTDHNYLMVPGVSSSRDTVANTFTFSNCTVKQIREHIFRRNGSAVLQCLQRHRVRKRRHFGFKNIGAHPGQLFDANQQCQLAFGATFRYCNAVEEGAKDCETCDIAMNVSFRQIRPIADQQTDQQRNAIYTIDQPFIYYF